MEEILKIEDLCKEYPDFSLKNVSFSIQPGEIMGFIGRNGAGKTTTLKCIMNLVHKNSGKIYTFGEDMDENELENKQKIGFALSEVNYYPNKTIKQLVNVTKRFYKNFNMDKFKQICNLFKLDLNKKIEELSGGMKVKFSVAVALSHEAELLILDEPTSGLDPISRDEISDIFKSLVKDKNRAILFSTHITSDLDKCATNITYIHDGEIVYSGKKSDFVNQYLFVKGTINNNDLFNKFIAHKEFESITEGLILKENSNFFEGMPVSIREPDLEEIMIYLERSKQHESFNL